MIPRAQESNSHLAAGSAPLTTTNDDRSNPPHDQQTLPLQSALAPPQLMARQPVDSPNIQQNIDDTLLSMDRLREAISKKMQQLMAFSTELSLIDFDDSNATEETLAANAVKQGFLLNKMAWIRSQIEALELTVSKSHSPRNIISQSAPVFHLPSRSSAWDPLEPSRPSAPKQVPKDMPGFNMVQAEIQRTSRRNFKDVDKYVIALERSATANGITLDNLVKMLPVLTNDAVSSWIERLLRDDPTTQRWVNFKPKFMAHFQDSLQLERDQQKFEAITIRSGQTILDFTDLYVEMMRKLNYDEKTSVHSQHLLARLPSQYAKEIAMIKLNQQVQLDSSAFSSTEQRPSHVYKPMSVEDIVRIVVQIESNNSFYNTQSNHQNSRVSNEPRLNNSAANNSKPAHATFGNGKAPNGNTGTSKKSFQCTLHGINSTHNDVDCIVQQNKRKGNATQSPSAHKPNYGNAVKSTSTTSPAQHMPSKERPCTICGSPDHWAPNCPQRSSLMNAKPTSNSAKMHAFTLHSFTLDDQAENVYSHSSSDIDAHDDCIYAIRSDLAQEIVQD